MKNSGKGNSAEKSAERVITVNRKAFHEYNILNKYEAGVVLTGTEVKSLRLHSASIAESYAAVRNGEVWLINTNIPEYKHGGITNHEPKRDRKLLLHRNEIKKITGKLQEKGLTLIPLKLYFSGARAKVEIGVAKGKKLYDKREAIKREEVRRRLKRVTIEN
jgi:SsrA-binding protein